VIQKCAGSSDQASIADCEDKLVTIDCSELADAENSDKGDAEEAKRADDELPDPLLPSPVED